MKSKVIKVCNLPADFRPVNKISVKPKMALCILILISLGLIISRTSLSILGGILMAFGIFALLVMPDRKLIEFGPQFLVLFNLKDREECKMIYWDEIMKWEYLHSQNSSDTLKITCVDGHVEMIECYKKQLISQYFSIYAQGKEMKQKRKSGSGKKN